MTLILLSILLSSLLVICFKVFEKFQVNNSNAISFNYISASASGFIFGYSEIIQIKVFQSDWFPYTLLFGLFFISVFNLIGIGVKKSGLIPVAISQKMSLIIPLAFSIYYYQEAWGLLKFAGIGMALIAIYLSSYKDSNNSESKLPISKNFLFPTLIFLGSGIVDVCIKITQEHLAANIDFSVLLTFIFGSAGIIGLLKSIVYRVEFQFKDLVAGLVLGLFNFSSTYVLMKALAQDHYESSFIFSINNIGIILFNTAVAAIVFKEKLNRLNAIGILIAILAITIIYFSNGQ